MKFYKGFLCLFLAVILCSTSIFAADIPELVAAIAPPLQLTIAKFTVKAGTSFSTDSVQFSGFLAATSADVLAADQVIVSLDSDNLISSPDWSFTVSETTFRNGVLTAANLDSSLKFDTRNGKITFSAKNANLTGMACPVTVTISIGSLFGRDDVDETIVNGSKKPCPPQLLMGAKNSMQIGKIQTKLGKTPGTDSVSVSGFFTISGNYSKTNPFSVTLGGQTFTVPASQFVTSGSSETCSNGTCKEGPQIKARFDFDKCTFQLQVSNAVIPDSGVTGFGINCFGKTLPVQDVLIPDSFARYELERYRCYDRFGRRWTYSANYSVRDSEGMTDSSGTSTGYVSVSNSPVYYDGNPCYSVTTSTSESSISSAWYGDYYGMHMYSWGNANDMISFETEMDALLAMPTLMSIGQTLKTSGAFTGNYELDLPYGGMDIDIYDFKGTASVETTLLGFEPVTVTYGSYASAAKVRLKQTLNGSMIVQVDYYGEILRAKFKFQAIIEQLWWGVENMGIVKTESQMLIKMGGAGANIWVALAETDQLKGYTP